VQTVKPSPAHFIMCGHAMALGAISAAFKAGDKLFKGETDACKVGLRM
jgi:hypothetical protein